MSPALPEDPSLEPPGEVAQNSRGWLLVVLVTALVLAVSLVGAWRLMRDPAPNLAASDRRGVYESNLENFKRTCEGHAVDPANVGLIDFCRNQALLLRRLPECDADCRRRTSTFEMPGPSR